MTRTHHAPHNSDGEPGRRHPACEGGPDPLRTIGLPPGFQAHPHPDPWSPAARGRLGASRTGKESSGEGEADPLATIPPPRSPGFGSGGFAPLARDADRDRRGPGVEHRPGSAGPVAGTRYALQLLDEDGGWRTLAPAVGPRGFTLSRTRHDGARHSRCDQLARFRLAPDGLRVIDLGGGVFRRLQATAAWPEGARLRIGRRTLALRRVTTPGLRGADAGLLAWLEEVRPDGATARRHPIIGPLTVVGRTPRRSNIALPDDPLISAQHALIYRQSDGGFLVEDLQSRNGTFLELTGPCLVGPGDVLLIGRTRLRVLAI